MVICYAKVNQQNGFSIYSNLKEELINKGIVFFLAIDQPDREDIMIALEMGIDNIIIYPIKKEVLLKKLENELLKRQKLNILKTQEFRGFFKFSMMPMFLVENGIVQKINPAFEKMETELAKRILNENIENIFELKEENNKLNYKRFLNHITQLCKIENAALRSNPTKKFHISLMRNQAGITDQFFAELLPSDFNGLKGPEIKGKKMCNNHTSPTIRLTNRERDVFELSSNGLPIKLIAEQLKLSKRTIEKHRSNIMEKTGSKNIIEAMAVLKKQSMMYEEHLEN